MSKKSKFVFSVLFISIIGLWAAYPFIINSKLLIDNFPTSSSWSNRGVIGDSFGALNTLFSGLALSGLALNIYIQGKQLKNLEDRELENDRLIKLQIRLMALTAALNYHGGECDRLNNIIVSVKDDYLNGSVDDSLKKVMENIVNTLHEHNKKRSEIMEELSFLLKDNYFGMEGVKGNIE